MQSNNPIFTRAEVVADRSDPMTVEGAVQKSVLMTVIAAVLGIAFYIFCTPLHWYYHILFLTVMSGHFTSLLFFSLVKTISMA